MTKYGLKAAENDIDLDFNANQPRDRKGRWTDSAAGKLATDGGFTVTATGKPVTEGIAVAVPPPGGRRDWLTKKGVTGEDLDAFVDEHTEALRDPGLALGGWRDPESGNDVIDVSKVTRSRREAASLALTGRQHSVFDLGAGEEIPTRDLLTDAIAKQPVGLTKYGDFLVNKRVNLDEHGDVASSFYDVSREGKRLSHKKMKDPAKIADRLIKETGPVSLPGTDDFSNMTEGEVLDLRGGAQVTRQDDGWTVTMGSIKNFYASAKALSKAIGSDLAFTQQQDITLSTLTPAYAGEFDLSVEDGKIAYWKQILPKKSIHYTAKDGTRKVLNFDDRYLTDLATQKAVDSIGFLLADKDNAHTMDPERWRGEVTELAVRDDGLYGKIVFPSLDAAKAVVENPRLGVSARIREGVARSDGSTVPRGIIHVLGTLDPQVSGMSPWQPVDLSAEHDEVLDLSDSNYEDIEMADDKKTETEKKALADYTEADIEAMTDEELTVFLTEHAPGLSDYAEPVTDNEPEPVLEGAGADMSQQQTADLDLANAAVATANARAEEAMRRVADAEWSRERDALITSGVPPAAIDLAAPVLNRPDDMVIDLSNSPLDEPDVNVSAVVRGLLDALKGTVDLSVEEGHSAHFDAKDGEDPDKALLDSWVI